MNKIRPPIPLPRTKFLKIQKEGKEDEQCLKYDTNKVSHDNNGRSQEQCTTGGRQKMEKQLSFNKTECEINNNSFIKQENYCQNETYIYADCDNYDNVNYYLFQKYYDCDLDTKEEQRKETLSETIRKTREKCLIQEFVKIEELYVGNLRPIIEDYLPYLFGQAPDHLEENVKYLFGNILQLYSEAHCFLSLLKESQNIEDVARLFINSVTGFELYIDYCKNKYRSDENYELFETLIAAKQDKLKDSLGLFTRLLCPIQHLTKYSLFLESIRVNLDISKDTEDILNSAKTVMEDVMRKSNDVIAIQSIKCCPLDLSKEGSFIMRSVFNILKPKKIRATIFLFEDIIVFTEKMIKNVEQLRYVYSISMSDLQLRVSSEKPTNFYLINYPALKSSGEDVGTYLIESDNEKIRNDWVKVIEGKLWMQLQKAKGV